VLFEQEAAAQMMASVMSDAARLHRKPLAPAGADAPQVLESVWASKVGAKVLPDWMSLVDDPGVAESQGVALVGAYSVDDEGVKAQKVTLVDKGNRSARWTRPTAMGVCRAAMVRKKASLAICLCRFTAKPRLKAR
jgi:hypothetical protein